MKLKEVYHFGDLTLDESLSQPLDYELIETKSYKDIVAKWYEIKSNPILIVATQVIPMDKEKIAEVSFFSDEAGFKAINKFNADGVSGILATVIDICQNDKEIDTWYFSAKQIHSSSNKELLKRTSLYLRVAKKMASKLNYQWKTFTWSGDTVYVVSSKPITKEKILAYEKYTQ